MSIRNVFNRKNKIVERMHTIQQQMIQKSKELAQEAREQKLENGVPYEIRKGDNLTKISQATGISVHDLAKDNGIKDKNVIDEGETIFFKHHHKAEDAINSDSMNEDFPDMRFQGYYLDKVEDEALERFEQVAEKGAQKYLEDNN